MIKNWYVLKGSPIYKHDCVECKYLFSVKFATDDEPIFVDIYEQCGLVRLFLFRFSSDPPAYSSGHSLEDLLTYSARNFIL